MSLKPLVLPILLTALGCTATTAAAPRAAGPGLAFEAGQGTGAGRPVAKSADRKANPELVCYFERPTGSNIPEKVCRSKTAAERDRERTQDQLRATPTVNSRPGS